MKQFIDLEDAQKLQDLSTAKQADEIAQLESYFAAGAEAGIISADLLMYHRFQDRIDIIIRTVAPADDDGFAGEDSLLGISCVDGEWVSVNKAQQCDRKTIESVGYILQQFWNDIRDYVSEENI